MGNFDDAFDLLIGNEGGLMLYITPRFSVNNLSSMSLP